MSYQQRFRYLLLLFACMLVQQVPGSTTRNAFAYQGVTATPTGEIAYIHKGDIILLNLEDGASRQLTTDGTIRDIAWSPDGRWLAYSSKRAGNYDIYMLLANGKSLTRITDDPLDDVLPAFSPRGVLYFVQMRGSWVDLGDNDQIIIEDRLHANWKKVSVGNGRCDVTNLSVLSDTQLTTTSNCRMSVGVDLLTRTTIGEEFQYLQSTKISVGTCNDGGQREFYSGSADWANTSSTLVFSGAACPDGDAQNWNLKVYLARFEDESEPVQLLDMEAGWFDWSPDDHWIVFDTADTYNPQFFDSTNSNLWIIESSGGEPRQIAPMGMKPAWRPPIRSPY